MSSLLYIIRIFTRITCHEHSNSEEIFRFSEKTSRLCWSNWWQRTCDGERKAADHSLRYTVAPATATRPCQWAGGVYARCMYAATSASHTAQCIIIIIIIIVAGRQLWSVAATRSTCQFPCFRLPPVPENYRPFYRTLKISMQNLVYFQSFTGKNRLHLVCYHAVPLL